MNLFLVLLGLLLFGCSAEKPLVTETTRLITLSESGETGGPVLYVVLAASDTYRNSGLIRRPLPVRDFKASKSEDTGLDSENSPVKNAEALSEFFLRQKTGSLYSKIVIRKLYNTDFTKIKYSGVLDGLSTVMEKDDALILFFSSYSGIDRNGDLFIAPWDGKNSSGKLNMDTEDILSSVQSLESGRVLVLVDTNRPGIDGKIPSAAARLLQSLEGKALLITADQSLRILRDSLDISEECSGAEGRYVSASYLAKVSGALSTSPQGGVSGAQDYFLFDRWLEPGELQINTLFPGTVTVTGKNNQSLSCYLESLEGTSFTLSEGNYTVAIAYRNGFSESRTAGIVNNNSASVSFNYRPSLSAGSFSGRLPAFGVNIAELNPASYKKVDQNVLSAMGMEQYRISFLAGEKFYRDGEYDRAITEYNRALGLKRDFADAYTGRGNAYRKRGNTSRAIEDYSSALGYGGQKAEVYNYRGYAYSESGEIDKAIADFTRALALKANYTDAIVNRAYAYYEKADYKRAIEDYSQVIRLEPRNAAAWNRRGSAYYRTGEEDRAIEDFTQALAIDNNYALALQNRGNALFNRGEYEKALADLSQAVRLNPSVNTYISRGNVLQKLGETDSAEADFAAARGMRQ